MENQAGMFVLLDALWHDAARACMHSRMVGAVDQSIGSGQGQWDIHDFIDHATKGPGKRISHAPDESASWLSGLLWRTILMNLEQIAAPMNCSTDDSQQTAL